MNTLENSREDEEHERRESDNTVDNSNNIANNEDYDSDMECIDQATATSEPSFTLEVEKGITPDPDTLNKENERDVNNVKK